MIRKFCFIFILALTLSLSGSAVIAHAQGTPYIPLSPIPGTTVDNTEYSPVDIDNYLKNIFLTLIGIAAGLAVIMITVGGLQYMSTDAVFGKSEGKQRITYAVGGLLLALSAFLILWTINPAILTFNLELGALPPPTYTGGDDGGTGGRNLDNSGDGYYVAFDAVKNPNPRYYGPYHTKTSCFNAPNIFTTDSGKNLLSLKDWCIDLYPEATEENRDEYKINFNGPAGSAINKAGKVVTQPLGVFIGFQLTTYIKDVLYGPFPSEDVCNKDRSTPSSERGTLYIEGPCMFNGSPGLIPTASPSIYEVGTAPTGSIYRTLYVLKDEGNRSYGPYQNDSSCKAADTYELKQHLGYDSAIFTPLTQLNPSAAIVFKINGITKGQSIMSGIKCLKNSFDDGSDPGWADAANAKVESGVYRQYYSYDSSEIIKSFYGPYNKEDCQNKISTVPSTDPSKLIFSKGFMYNTDTLVLNATCEYSEEPRSIKGNIKASGWYNAIPWYTFYAQWRNQHYSKIIE